MIVFRRVPLRLWSLLILILISFIIIHFNQSRKSSKCRKLCPYSSKIINGNLQFDSSHIIRHYPEFVCPQNFRNLADWIYRWPDQFNEHIDITTDDGETIAPCLPSGSIIYVRIWAIDVFFHSVYPHLINNFVLITGEGDLSSPTNLQYLEHPDSKIIHWFGQNGQYDVSKIKKFTHIPIGINCYEMADAIQTVYSQQLNSTFPPVFHDYDEPIHYIQPLDVSRRKFNENLVLINFDKNTDGTKLRSRVWEDFCTVENQKLYPFITCIEKPGGVQIKNIPKIYQRNRQYPFWLSPRGNGLDCHRTWEALYLDIIPIVWNNSLNVLYENLPVIILNHHQELNSSFLLNQFDEISKKKLLKPSFYHYEKLRHSYWRRLILSKSRHKDIYQRKNQCWRANSLMKSKYFYFF